MERTARAERRPGARVNKCPASGEGSLLTKWGPRSFLRSLYGAHLTVQVDGGDSLCPFAVGPPLEVSLGVSWRVQVAGLAAPKWKCDWRHPFAVRVLLDTDRDQSSGP